MISRSSNGWNKQIDNNNQIEIFDLTSTLLENSLNQSYKQAANLKDTELCTKSNIHCL